MLVQILGHAREINGRFFNSRQRHLPKYPAKARHAAKLHLVARQGTSLVAEHILYLPQLFIQSAGLANSRFVGRGVIHRTVPLDHTSLDSLHDIK